MQARIYLCFALVAIVTRARPLRGQDAGGIVSAKELTGRPSIEQIDHDIQALAIARAKYADLVAILTKRQIATAPIVDSRGAVYQGAPNDSPKGRGGHP